MEQMVIDVYEGLIKEKVDMIRFYTNEITIHSRLKEKYNNNNLLIFKLNSLIQDDAKYITALYKSINGNREIVNGARRKY